MKLKSCLVFLAQFAVASILGGLLGYLLLTAWAEELRLWEEQLRPPAISDQWPVVRGQNGHRQRS